MPVERSSKHLAPLSVEWAYLMGRPTMEESMEFIQRHSIDKTSDPSVLEKRWTLAKSRYDELATKEAGLADDPPISDIPKELESLIQQVHADPVYQKVYSGVKHRFGMVELDRLVVFQRYMDLSFIKGLESTLAPKMGPEDVFRLAMPFDHPLPEFKISEPKQGECIFESPSTDLRFLDSVVLQKDQLDWKDAPGPLAGVLGLVVGFGCNFLTAVQVGNRLILNNGTHRAYLLRKLGIQQAPIIIQTVKDRQELKQEVHGDVPDNLEYYLDNPRPSLLKDYFDTRLVYHIHARPRVRRIHISYDVKVLTEHD